MNTKALFPCGGGSNLILGTGRKNQMFVYQMGRLCKISGIPAPLCLCGWVVGGFMGWVDGWVGAWWCGWGGWLEGSWGGWMCGGGVGGWRVHEVGGGGVGGWRVHGVGGGGVGG